MGRNASSHFGYLSTTSERVRKEWEKVAGLAAVLVLAMAIAPQIPGMLSAPAAAEVVNSVYYVKSSAWLALALFVIYSLFHTHPRPDNFPSK